MTDDTKPKPVPGQPLPPKSTPVDLRNLERVWQAKKLKPVPRVVTQDPQDNDFLTHDGGYDPNDDYRKD